MLRPFVIVACVLSTACAPSVLGRASAVPTLAASYTPSDGDEFASALAELEARVKGWGVDIQLLAPTDQAAGRALVSGGPRTIYLSERLQPNARLEVLAHEAGHLFQSPTIEDRAVAEVFAELVSVGVCRFYGHDTRHTAAQYLAAFKTGFAAAPFMRSDIDAAIKALTGQAPLPKGWLR